MSHNAPKAKSSRQPAVNSACESAQDHFRSSIEGQLPPSKQEWLDKHLAACVTCANEFETQRQLIGLMSDAFSSQSVSETFDLSTNRRLLAMSGRSAEVRGRIHESAASQDDEAMLAGAFPEERTGARIMAALGAAPWWGVSVVLHILVIALAGLISMAVSLPQSDDLMVTVTELAPRPKIEEIEPQKQLDRSLDPLHSRQETPPTDPTSKEVCSVVVPPELLAQAQLGDRFETINPDRPDTQSAFGNPESAMFHSKSGSDEPAGGGGMEGSDLADVIGVGGASSPGSGGGWGGGHGTGIGTGNGPGSGSFGSRTGGGRQLMVKRHGGNKATEDAVDRALAWLARNQEADGHWNGAKHGASMAGDTALSGLAVLAFLGAGHTEKIGKYKDNVKRGVAWLIAQQDNTGRVMKPGDGSNAGYNHPIAGLALAEAAAMARIPETMAAAQKAVDYSVNIHQEGEGSERRGWRYSPKELGDISTSGWFIMQLKSAKVAGLKVDVMALEGGNRYLDTVEVEKPAKGDPYGVYKFGYRADAGGGKVRIKNPHCNTAIGCLGRLFLGMPPGELNGTVEWFIKEGGLPDGNKPEFYHWYYATLASFQVGGEPWKKWNEALKTALLGTQCKGGDNDGSWDPKGHSTEGAEHAGGRVFTTAIGALCMEVYYRYALLNRQ